MDSGLMFLDCPAYLDRAGGQRCGLPAEVRCRFIIRSAGGPLESAMISYPAGHCITGPLKSLSLNTEPWLGRRSGVPGRNGRRANGVAAMMTGRVGTGIGTGAGLPGTPLPGHRPVRHAGRVIVLLSAIGLAAAVACALLLVVALAGGPGPHFPGPPPHPVPVPNPAPAPPGS